MRRREFITLLGGAAAAWPLGAHAQRAGRTRRIAVMMNKAEGDPEGEARAAALRRGLQELGWTEGQNLRIDWLWSGGDGARVHAYAAELAGAPPDLIDPPSGCRFHPRCPDAMRVCPQKDPVDQQLAFDHRVECWLHGPRNEIPTDGMQPLERRELAGAEEA